jgi:hypothetical protein
MRGAADFAGARCLSALAGRRIAPLRLDGWEFDMRDGQSYFDPARVKIRTYPVVIEDGETLAKGPYVAETFPVHIEDSYVIVET